MPCKTARFLCNFNPRSPHGERPAFPARRCSFLSISIHAPRTGSDRAASSACHSDKISIHAPRTGSDATSGRTSRRRTEISIHAPRTGSDGKATDMTCPTLSFQSTLPARGATRTATHKRRRERFQSTLPARGATFCWSRSRLAGRHFNPRSPHGERLKADDFPALVVRISIHAPRTGSDLGRDRASAHHAHFNPRSPHGERLLATI
mgnify:CR=1 FL=1